MGAQIYLKLCSIPYYITSFDKFQWFLIILFFYFKLPRSNFKVLFFSDKVLTYLLF